jgi:hypothetical protein
MNRFDCLGSSDFIDLRGIAVQILFKPLFRPVVKAEQTLISRAEALVTMATEIHTSNVEHLLSALKGWLQDGKQATIRIQNNSDYHAFLVENGPEPEIPNSDENLRGCGYDAPHVPT